VCQFSRVCNAAQLELNFAEKEAEAAKMRVVQGQTAEVKQWLVDEELTVEREIKKLEAERVRLVRSRREFCASCCRMVYSRASFVSSIPSSPIVAYPPTIWRRCSLALRTYRITLRIVSAM
jgi:hypothetical protein